MNQKHFAIIARGMDAAVSTAKAKGFWWSMRSILLCILTAWTLLVCTACPEPDPVHTHEWEWVITTPATPTADGLETETCKTCGAINNTRPIAKLQDTPQQDRSGTVALDRGLGTITVQVMGMTTQAEWNDIANKIVGSVNNRLNTDIDEDSDTWLDGYTELFGRGIIFIVEPNPVGYNSYKLIGDGKTVYIALDKVDTKVPANVVVDLYQRNTMVDGVAVTPHTDTITAFGKTAQVTGDASISTADFNTAVKNLSDTLIYMDSVAHLLGTVFNVGCINMMDRGITITAGNAVPASVNGALTVGVDYLKAGDVETIGEDIANLASKGAFADPATPTVPAPATITHTSAPNALAFTGSVTIKSDDPYTAAEWDAVVAKVVAKPNALYDATEEPVLYTIVFGGVGVEIVLVNNLATNCEVKKTLPEGEGVKGVLYIKTDSVNSISLDHYEMVFVAVYQNDSFTPQ